MSELDFATAEALAEMIRAKQLSPVELMDHTLARVEALNPELGAFVALDAERARSEAAAQSERLAKYNRLLAIEAETDMKLKTPIGLPS